MNEIDLQSLKYIQAADIPNWDQVKSHLKLEVFQKLDKLIEQLGRKPYITSTYRTDSEFHITGNAVDVEWIPPMDQKKVVEYATLLGFNGIGYYMPDGHFHFDCVFRPGQPIPYTWGHVTAGYCKLSDLLNFVYGQKTMLLIGFICLGTWILSKFLK